MTALNLMMPTLGSSIGAPAYPGIAKTMSEARLPSPPTLRLVVPTPRRSFEEIDERFDAAIAEVDWGDTTDYGEDVVSPPVERRHAALAFLRRLARSAQERFNIPLPVPEVSPTVDGDVDLHWRASNMRELLICVRANGLASFFGRSGGGQTIKGVVRTDEENSFIAAWISAVADEHG